MHRCPLGKCGYTLLDLDYIENSVQQHINERHYDESGTCVFQHQDAELWKGIPSQIEKEEESPANRSRAKSAPPARASIE